MLKKLAKRIQKEISQAEDYCTQAFLVKHKDETTAQLFVELAGEEIDHAKRLLKDGERLINQKSTHVRPYEITAKSVTDTDAEEHLKKCKIIWEWEQRIAMETISEIMYKLSQFHSM